MTGVQMQTWGGIVGGLLLASTAAGGEMYRCEQDGRVTFSQLPCGQNAQRVELENATQPAATGAPAVSVTPAMDVDAYVEERRYRRRLEQLNGRRKALVQERDRRIAELEKQIPLASNYSVYSSIRRDINNIRRDYNRDINLVDTEIRTHRHNKPKSLK